MGGGGVWALTISGSATEASKVLRRMRDGDMLKNSYGRGFQGLPLAAQAVTPFFSRAL